MSNKFPAIPECSTDVRQLQNTVLALKEAVELLTGQRGPMPVVLWDDLVRMGIVSQEDKPR